MKASHLLIICLLAGLVYMFGAGMIRLRPEDRDAGRQTPPEVKSNNPNLRQTRTTVDPAAPIPEVHPSKAVVLQGLVTSIDKERAMVNCSYRAPSSSQANTSSRIPGAYREGMRAAEQAASKKYGSVKTADTSGQLRLADWTPSSQLSGEVVLTGAVVGINEHVNVIVVPDPSPNLGARVYTARFKSSDSRWMWSRSRDNPLERKF